MLKIRLKPTGRKKRISYRIVVSEARSNRDGKATDDLGYYNPHVKPEEVKIDKKKLEHWLSYGAKMNKAVKKLIYEKNQAIS